MGSRIDDTVLTRMVLDALRGVDGAFESLGGVHDEAAPTWSRIIKMKVVPRARVTGSESTDMAEVNLVVAVETTMTKTDGPARITTLAMKASDAIDEQRLEDGEHAIQFERSEREYMDDQDADGIRTATVLITIKGLAQRATGETRVDGT